MLKRTSARPLARWRSDDGGFEVLRNAQTSLWKFSGNIRAYGTNIWLCEREGSSAEDAFRKAVERKAKELDETAAALRNLVP